MMKVFFLVFVLVLFGSIGTAQGISCNNYYYALGQLDWNPSDMDVIISAGDYPWETKNQDCIYEGSMRFYLWMDLGFNFYFNSQARAGAKVNVFGFKTQTFTPFPDQLVSEWTVDRIGYMMLKPCATARVRVDVLSNSTFTENGWPIYGKYYQASFDPQGKLDDYFVGGTNSAVFPNSGIVLWNNVPYDGGIGHFRQTNYTNSSGYSKVPGATISNWGCFMTSACNVLLEIGIYVDPPTMNGWLKQENGFSGLKVDGQAIVRVVRKHFGVNLRYLRKELTVDQALTRDIPTIVSVHDTGHWVGIQGKSRQKDGTFLTRIVDPNGVRDTKFLESNWGFSTSDTRSWYKIPKPTPGTDNRNVQRPDDESDTSVASTSMAICSTSSSSASSASTTKKPQYGLSAITAMSEDPGLSLSLISSGQTVAQGENEVMENATTGETVNLGPSLYYSPAPKGNYSLVVRGTPGTMYKVALTEDDDEGTSSPRTFTGTIGETGEVRSEFTHQATAYVWSLASLHSLAAGDTAVVMDGIVTAVISPTELMVQPITSRTPAVLVRNLTTNKSMVGKSINWLKGTTAELSNGRKAVDLIPEDQNPTLRSVSSDFLIKPVGVPFEKLKTTNGLYSRIVTKVTEDKGYDPASGRYTIVLNETLPAISFSAFDTQVGDLVVMDGVEKDGTFYVSYPNNKQILK